MALDKVEPFITGYFFTQTKSNIYQNILSNYIGKKYAIGTTFKIVKCVDIFLFMQHHAKGYFITNCSKVLDLCEHPNQIKLKYCDFDIFYDILTLLK